MSDETQTLTRGHIKLTRRNAAHSISQDAALGGILAHSLMGASHIADYHNTGRDKLGDLTWGFLRFVVYQ